MRARSPSLPSKHFAWQVVFFGPPGVGKGTFAKRVAPIMDVPHLSTGDILRAEIKAGSATGKEAKSYTDAGELVPDDFITKVVAERLQDPDCANGYILDGYPRTVQQAKDFDKVSAGSHASCAGQPCELPACNPAHATRPRALLRSLPHLRSTPDSESGCCDGLPPAQVGAGLKAVWETAV